MPLAAAPTLGLGVGAYQYGRQPAYPLVVSDVRLSGWTAVPDGSNALKWQRVDNVQLDPAHTRLTADCSCPIHWQVNPL
jgi:hypothetical protein